MVYGRQHGVPSSKYGEIRDLERTFGPRRKVLSPPHYFANNANSAISRKLWEEHPFDEDLTGQEDIEWAKHWMDRGYAVIYEPEAGIYHIHHETWRQVQHRYYRESLATRNIGVWNRADAARLALKEVAYFSGDIVDAIQRGHIVNRWSEIVKFRYNKSLGTVRGLLEGDDLKTAQGRESLFFDRKCSGVVIHSAGHATLEEIDVPSVKPSEVLIKAAYTGVTNADVGLFDGDASFHKGATPRYPVTPGSEMSGWVAKVGANVKHLKQGDPVVVQSSRGCGACDACAASEEAYCEDASSASARFRGAYAEFLTVPGRYVHKLPENADVKQAVICDALAVVVKALNKLEAMLRTISSLPRFAVVGAGPIGHLFARMLALREYPVTVFDDNPRRLAYFNGSSISTSANKSELGQYDYLIEATGAPEALQNMLDMSKPGATLLLLGLPYSHRSFSIEGGNTLDKTIIWSAGAGKNDFCEAIELLPQLPVKAMTDFALPLSNFKEAWDSFRKGEHLKVLVQVAQDTNSLSGLMAEGEIPARAN
jgi:2-desacetyl-2-hydroxyethyl bacteriochlorophyllide A dehydrogenase